MENKQIEIPIDQWANFINILYAAIQHITPTEENADVMQILHKIVRDAFKNKEVLIVDGKIVDRE